MKRVAILFTAAGALALGLSGQTSPPEIIARLEKSLQAIESLQADFEQSSYSMTASTPLREKGRLYVQKPDRMRWEYKDPEAKTFIVKNGLLLSFFPEDNQLWRQRIPPEEFEGDIFGLLSGKARLAEKYTIEASPFPGAGPDAAQLKLTPKEEGDNASILLEIDRANWLLRRVILFDWAGNKTEFAFLRVKTNLRLAKDAFDLKVPPGCEIIDGEPGRKK